MEIQEPKVCLLLALIFSSMALKVLGNLVSFFLSSANHTDYWSLWIISEKTKWP